MDDLSKSSGYPSYRVDRNNNDSENVSASNPASSILRMYIISNYEKDLLDALHKCRRFDICDKEHNQWLPGRKVGPDAYCPDGFHSKWVQKGRAVLFRSRTRPHFSIDRGYCFSSCVGTSTIATAKFVLSKTRRIKERESASKITVAVANEFEDVVHFRVCASTTIYTVQSKYAEVIGLCADEIRFGLKCVDTAGSTTVQHDHDFSYFFPLHFPDRNAEIGSFVGRSQLEWSSLDRLELLAIPAEYSGGVGGASENNIQ